MGMGSLPLDALQEMLSVALAFVVDVLRMHFPAVLGIFPSASTRLLRTTRRPPDYVYTQSSDNVFVVVELCLAVTVMVMVSPMVTGRAKWWVWSTRMVPGPGTGCPVPSNQEPLHAVGDDLAEHAVLAYSGPPPTD